MSLARLFVVIALAWILVAGGGLSMSASAAPGVMPAGVSGAAALDAYEPDNTTATAKAIDGGVHSFAISGGTAADTDWMYFDAEAGHQYAVSSFAYDRGGNVIWLVPLEIRDTSATRILAYQTWFDRWYADYWTLLARVNWTAPATGRYFVRAYDIQNSPNSATQYTVSLADYGVSAPGTVARVDGADRYEVAAKLARNDAGTFAGTTDIIIASGLDAAMADALSAAGLAGVLNAPVLLVRGDRAYLPAPTKSAIVACAAENPDAPLRFHIVGGTASVPKVLEGQMKAAAGAGSSVERIAGADRYAVAANAAVHMRSHGAASRLAYVVNGQNPTYFADALAVAPLARGYKRPILLVKSASVPAATSAQFAYYTSRYVAGTPRAIPPTVYQAIMKGAVSGSWADGTSRDTVARNVAEREEHGYEVMWSDRSNTYQYTVTNKLSDALAAGCSPALKWRYVLYVNASTDSRGLLLDGTEQFLASRIWGARGVTIIGGTASVTPAVESRLRYLMGDTAP